MKMRIESDLIV